MLEKLKEIVLEAGEIFKEGYFSTKDVQFKGKKDLVTQYDIAIENFLLKEFKLYFKDFDILAEEEDTKEFENGNLKITNTIVIDPIDGTTNFVNGIPHCAISVGVFKNSQPFIGIVYVPILGDLYYAQVGKGAYLNGDKILVSEDKSLDISLIATGFPYISNTQEALKVIINQLKNVLPRCQDIRRLGSAAVDMCMVSRGVFEGYYEIGLKPWDLAGGFVILSESGGMISDEFGNNFDINNISCIVATNRYIHRELLEILNLNN
jgi:myo-inositol-1(or 4)-monophosphatase